MPRYLLDQYSSYPRRITSLNFIPLLFPYIILHSGASIIIYFSSDVSTSSNKAQGPVYKFGPLSPHIYIYIYIILFYIFYINSISNFSFIYSIINIYFLLLLVVTSRLPSIFSLIPLRKFGYFSPARPSPLPSCIKTNLFPLLGINNGPT